MTQQDKARRFHDLHVSGNPVILYNIWDAGGAQAVAEAGAQAIATGSWSVAAAHGYGDGEQIPIELVLQLAARIAGSVALPVTLDFEGAYAETPEGVATNTARVIAAGIVGINFEDQVVGGTGLYAVEAQCARIAAARQAADDAGVALFINARTDLFLKEPDHSRNGALVESAKERAVAYAAAGASGFFVPGLVDPALITAICAASPLPVNVMALQAAPSFAALAACGVARVSHGPGPYRHAIEDLAARARQALQTA